MNRRRVYTLVGCSSQPNKPKIPLGQSQESQNTDNLASNAVVVVVVVVVESVTLQQDESIQIMYERTLQSFLYFFVSAIFTHAA